MKSTLPIALLLISDAVLLHGQDSPSSTTASSAPISSAAAIAAMPPTPDGYTVSEIGANQRRWTCVINAPDPLGRPRYTTNSYIELQDSMYYVRPGPAGPEWAESKAEIEAFPGGAIARQGPVQLIFPNDLSAEPIDAQTASGRFRSAVLCLSYADYGLQTNLIIAEIQPCQGQIIASNQVWYPKAFNNAVAGSVRYTYRRSGWEQDVLIDDPGSLPAPESMGLDSASPGLVLQVVTEFLEAPPANTSPMAIPGPASSLQDQDVDWGALRLGQGQALFLGRSKNPSPLPTSKHWVVTPDRRQFLVEEVPFAQLLRDFFSPSGGAWLEGPAKKVRGLASLDRLPRLKPAKPDSRPMELAAVRPPERGLIIDYVTLSATATNYTFSGEGTYFISSGITLLGSNVWEGGATLKFATNSSILVTRQYNIDPQIAFLTKPWLPVVFTAKDENSIGQSISGSTGNPTNYYAACALSLYGLTSAPAIANLRIAYAQQGLNVYGLQPGLTNVAFVGCQNGIQLCGSALSLRNVLFANTQTNFNSLTDWTSINAQNVTFSGSARLISTMPQSSNISFGVTNGLFVNVTSLNPTNATLTGGYNGFFNTTPFGANTRTNAVYPFKTVGAGAFYLDPTNSSSFRHAGTTNMDPNLLAALRQSTTYPPVLYSNLVFTVATNLAPQAQRDTLNPDLGWHYFPLDYLCSCSVSNATLTLTNGVAIGYLDNLGIRLDNNGRLDSCGTPLQRNYLLHYSLVQEQPIGLYPHGLSMPMSFGHTDASRNPSVSLRFSTLAAPPGANWVAFADTGGWQVSSLNLRDSEIYAAGATWHQCNDPAGTIITLQNNLFQYTYFDAETPAQLTAYNNLFRGTTTDWIIFYNTGAGQFLERDNAFDGCSPYLDGTIGCNAFLNGAILQSGNPQASDVTANLTWLTGPLGNCYQPPNSPLINQGSRTAALAGLYHYTTQTNQLKEGSSVVDIGVHYISLGTNGLPMDINGDGVPDYVADSNGDGVTQTNEVVWGVGIASQPQNTSAVQGTDASFSVVASGVAPFTYQWRFNGTNIVGATGSTCTRIVVLTNDAGNYSVIVANATGSLPSSNALLTVIVPLAITNFYPLATNCVQGSNVSFHVQVSGTTPACQWWHNSSPLTNGARISGATSADLTISNLSTNDSGSYFVVVTNLAGSVTSATATLNVYAPISLGPLQVTPSPVVQAGDTTFSVTSSDPLAAFQWRFQSTNIPSANSSNYTRLVMQPSQDAGTYSILATNLAGPVSASTNITVLVPPLITNQPANVQTNLGATVRFSVGISTNSATPLAYRWYFNQTNLVTWATNYLSAVTLTNVQNTNSGWYSVLVSNLVGTNWSITAFLSLGGSNGLSTNLLQVPNVAMVRPTNTVATNAAIYPYGAPIALRASATVTDLSSYLTQVAFYGGTNLSLTDSNLLSTAVVGANATYAFRYTNPPLGTNWARAVAWDSKGRSNSSQVVYYIINQAPAVTTAPTAITLVWRGYTTNAWFTNYLSDDGFPYHITNIFWTSLNGIASLTSYTNRTATNIIISTLATFTNYGSYAPRLNLSDGNVTNGSTCGILVRCPAYVQITRPTNSTLFWAGTPIALNATAYATNYGPSVSTVAFYNGTNLIGTAWRSTGNTYALAWTNAPLWTNVVTAVATDSGGIQSTSPPVTVTVLPYLYVWINSPTNNQVFVTSPTNILFIVSPSNYFGGAITSVNFSNGSTFLGQGLPQTNSAAYQFLWQNVTNGTYTIVAQASDSYGDVATNSVTFTVNAMPLVQITSPTNLASFREVTNITLQATARDSDGTVTNLQFFFGTTLIPGTPSVNNVTNFSLTWNNRGRGAYPVTAIATDNRGAPTFSDIRVFRVTSSNLPPTVTLTNPVNGAVFPAGADLTLCATASSTNGIALVEFFQDDVRLGGDAAPPYQLLVHGLWPGTYQFCAKATDTNGLSNVSQIITNTVLDRVPLSANGYWDPAFHRLDWNSGFAPNAVPLALGASNQVYAFDWYLSSQGYIQSWESCAWAQANGLGPLWGCPVRTMVPRGRNVLLGGTFNVWPIGYTVASYDGTNLTDLSFGLNDAVWALHDFKGDLIAGGAFTQAGTNGNVQYIAKLSGNTWVPLGSALDGAVLAIASIGDDLYIGGDFTSAGRDTNVAYVAKLVGTNWVALGSGVSNPAGNPEHSPSFQGAVSALAVWNGQLVVGGCFTQVGGDTNAACLAKWDGTSWSTLGNLTFSSDDPNYPPAVFGLAVHGNDVFVAGLFDTVTVGSGAPLRAQNVAHLQWDSAAQTWNWYALDLGLASQYRSEHAWGGSLVLRPSTISNSLDVIVGGNFDHAGPVVSYQVARWIIGATDCTNANPPSVSFYQPLSSQTYPPGQYIPVGANTQPGGGSYVSGVTFYTNGVFLGAGQMDSDNTNHYYLPTNELIFAQGTYRLEAVAVDADNLANKATIYVNVASNSAPALSPDQYVVLVNDPPTLLYVLTNDDASALRIKSVSSLQSDMGTVLIAPGATNLLFQPAPSTYGTVYFGYSATNAAGIAGYTTVTVKIREKPVAAIGTPSDGASFAVSTNLLITGTVLDYDTAITNLAVYINGSLCAHYAPTNINYFSHPTNFFFGWNPAGACPQTSYALFALSWTTNVPGYYKVTVTASDTYGYVSSSDALTPLTIVLTNSFTATNRLIASLDNLPVMTNTLGVISNTVIRDGFFDLQGKARDPIGADPVTYQLLLYQPGDSDTPFANVTPPPRDAAAFHLGGDTNNSLGRLDLSAIPNGAYDLKLIVHGGGAQTNATARFILDSQLKIGQFSFSEQDLVLPVSGIPITITRSYNSLRANGSPRPSDGRGAGGEGSDFGPGWTLALNSMDVRLDDERQDVTIGSDQAPFADVEEDAYGRPLLQSIRTGGGLDVTLTLPDGRRTTFAFNPRLDPPNGKAYAQWTAPPGVYAVLTNFIPAETEIDFFPSLHWASDDFTFAPPAFECHDVPGWVLVTQEGTQYRIERAGPNNVVYDTTGNGSFVNVRAYGPPQLTKILQRTGDEIHIGPDGISHWGNGTNLTRRTWFERDPQGRITAIRDPISGSNGAQVVKYVYNQDTGNLIQVLKLIDRAAGIYATNKYWYGNSQFPHYITQIDNGLGVPITRNYYDSSGRLTSTVDANNNTTQFIHNLTNNLELVVDPLGHTNTFAYDSRGNVTAVTNALNGITLSNYDDDNDKTNEVVYLNGAPYATNAYGYDPSTGLLSVTTNALGLTNGFTYDAFGQLLTSTDARGNTATSFYDANSGNLLRTADCLGGTATNVYGANGLLVSATDAAGAVTTNQYDSVGNMTFSRAGYCSNNTFVALTSTGYGYDNDGNCVAVTNALGVVTRYLIDSQSRVIAATNAWGTADQTVMLTTYDAAGRVVQTVDARGVTNAFGYDFAGHRTSTTRALGSPLQQVTRSIYDPAGNRTSQIDHLGRVTDFQFDALNRQTVVLFPAPASGAARTGITNVYDKLDRQIAVTNQAGVATGFQFDLLSQMVGVTNALGKLTQFQFDPLGNQTNQTDALNRNTRFAFDALTRRTQRTMPGGQAESFGFDKAGRLQAQTNFDATMITNQYDVLGRLLKRCNGATVLETYAYSATGQLTNRTDASGTYKWVYDNLGRLKTNTTPIGTLYYTYDANGNLLTLSSATANGVSLTYQYDKLNRLTNVIDNRLTGTKNTRYTFDAVGNLKSLSYPNGITNLWQYDGVNRLTNLTWKLNGAQRGDFTYQLGPAGNRTNLVDNVNGTSRTFSWGYDNLYRLTNETVTGGPPIGSLGYVYDDVGNRLNRTGSLGSLTASTNTFDVNDWISGVAFDANGNARTNGASWYTYDWANRLTAFTNGSAWATLTYDADGNRVKKVTSAATTLYLVASVNPSGYSQVVEESTVSGGTTNLSMVYTYGLALISQRQANGTVAFFGADGLGSTRFLTSTNGTITNSYTCDAYGTLLASTGSTPNNYLYCGEQWDPDLSLYYLRARYFNPGTGRFWTMDSFEGSQADPLSLHKYSYCQANPVNGTDPTGLDFDMVSFMTATGVGEALESMYNSGVLIVGNSLKNTIIGVQQGYSVGQIIAINITENVAPVVAGKAIGLAARLRKLPGVVKGAGQLIQQGRWLRGTQGNAAFIPQQVGVKLAGQKFANFDEFRAAFWKLVGKDAELSRGFSVQNVAAMKKGYAPTAPLTQQVGGRAAYELHHITPIQNGGDVYDLDNLIVCTPRYHQDVLAPAYHY
jgi:RHS repeat-associated protein